MTETYQNLKESYKIYKCYSRLYKLGVLRVQYTFEQVYNCYKNNKEVVNG